MLITEFLSSIFQTLIFTLIPFIWWLITARKKENFFSWIGLKKVEGNKKQILLLLLIFFIICEVTGQISTRLFITGDWNHSTYAGMGIKGLPMGILYAYIHTGLSEEILYRGFLQKRLQKQFGFKVGTFIQAFIFGLSHVVLSAGLLDITIVEGIMLLVYPMIPACLTAYLNEKKCNGSILPGWLIHGTLNLITQITELW